MLSELMRRGTHRKQRAHYAILGMIVTGIIALSIVTASCDVMGEEASEEEQIVALLKDFTKRTYNGDARKAYRLLDSESQANCTLSGFLEEIGLIPSSPSASDATISATSVFFASNSPGPPTATKIDQYTHSWPGIEYRTLLNLTIEGNEAHALYAVKWYGVGVQMQARLTKESKHWRIYLDC